MAAFDTESVLGTKPKVCVQVTRTPRVKKLLANRKKAAEMRKPASRPNVGGRRSTPVVTTVEVPKKTTNKGVGKAKEKEEAGGGEEPCDQSILSGSAGNRITPTLSLAKCITGTRPEYVRYYHGIGIGKKKELLVWSKCLSIRNMMANSQQVQPKDNPKWIPKQFLSVTTQVLIDRIKSFIGNVQPKNTVFAGNKNTQNQLMSGFPPHGTSLVPMNSRGDNQLLS